ncbi:MAG: hypothetical protein HFI33_11665 [Lachnospiraceae bacterium]|nr:hypothetical protein [Lachnospiraceae bacterium]
MSRQKNIGYLTLYIFLFPQLIAGPIVRYKDIENQINISQESWDKIRKGAGRFIIGLAKKVLISNQLGYIVEKIMEWPLSEIPTKLLWLVVLTYTMQIYFDFSGYSDMAIGVGNLFGFQFQENFEQPYCSVSVTDFWRRWHISLGILLVTIFIFLLVEIEYQKFGGYLMFVLYGY